MCPSWSWAAWAGEVFFHDYRLSVTKKLLYVARPWLEVEKRKTMNPVDVARALGHTYWTSLSDGVVLRLKIYILSMNYLDIIFKSKEDITITWWKTRFRLKDQLYISKSYRKKRLQRAFLDYKFSLAILCFQYNRGIKSIVIKEGPNHSQRVGVVSFDIYAAEESGIYTL